MTNADAPMARFEYRPGTLRYGQEATSGLAEEVERLGQTRALVVCGRTVGSTPAVMEPIREGLGDRIVGVFDETTPEKRFATAVAGARTASDLDAEVLIAVGGGSSLDLAKAVATIAGSDRSVAAIAREFEATASIAVPADPLPIVAVPTTFAGADATLGAGLTADPGNGYVDEPVDGGLSDPAIRPAATVYDPDLVATTPRSVLAGSAMNGFDKGLEALYSRHATPVTDATASRGLGRFREGLLAFAEDGPGDGEETQETDGAGSGNADHEAGVPAAVEGLLLCQYGVSRPDVTTMGPIHALGQALSRAGVHQGTAHAIVAPHLLELTFERVDGRRALLADGLGVDDGAGATDGATATAVVDAVTEVRNALGIPTRLRDVETFEREDVDDVAAAVADHRFLENGPAGFDPDADDLRTVLEAAW